MGDSYLAVGSDTGRLERHSPLTSISLFFLAVVFALQVATAEEQYLSAFDRTPFQLERLGEGVDVRIDGVVSEAAWDSATTITDFRLVNRDVDDMQEIELATTARVFYNDKGMYVSFEMEQDEGTFVKIHSASDGGSLNRDFVTVALDTSGEGKYGFYFTLFLGDSKRDGVLQPERSWQKEWDGAWHGRTSHHTNGWSAEFFIPWSILSMPNSGSERTLGVLVSRRIAGVGRYYSWPAIHDTSTKFLSDLHPVVVTDVKPRQQLSFIPFVATTLDTVSDASNEQVGADIFWRPTPNFQLTATALPDFGTVEADDVIINLTVFETFFPDKRLFFIEGRQIFRPQSWYGTGTIPFHSRRIGDRPSVPTVPNDVRLDYSRLSQGTDLLGAVKGVGQFGRLRYGVLAAWEDDATFGAIRDGEQLTIEVPGRDFGIVRLLYEDSQSGYLRLGMLSTAKWDRTAGDAFSYTIDGRYTTPDGNLGAEAQLFISDVNFEDTGYGGYIGGYYRSHTSVQHGINFRFIDDSLNLNALGYNSRNDQAQFIYDFVHTDYSPKRFQAVGTGIHFGGVWNSEGERTYTNIALSRNIVFKNRDGISLGLNLTPSHLNDTVAYQVEKFHTDFTYSVFCDWNSDNAKKIFYGLNGGYQTEVVEGGFAWAGAGVGLQPNESFRMFFRLSKGFRDGWLRYRGGGSYTRFESWGPRATIASEYSVGPRQQIRFDLQWRSLQGKGIEFYTVPNGTTDLVSTGKVTERRDDFAFSGLSLQLRYRWEIAPMSDVYLVLTKTASLGQLRDNSMFATLRDLLKNSDTENFATKIRYRFGS